MLEHMVQFSSSKSSSYSYNSLQLNQQHPALFCPVPTIPILAMSSPEKSAETFANANAHPTAVKAGGMRIVQDKTHLKKKSDTPVPKPEEDALKVSTSPPKQIDLMSGATTKLNDGFPAAAVQAFHDKPAPTRDINNSHKPTVIQQPRK